MSQTLAPSERSTISLEDWQLKERFHLLQKLRVIVRECAWGLGAPKKDERKKENRMTSSSFYMCSPIWRACVSDLAIFVEEENVSCLSRPVGSPRSRGGRVAQLPSGSVEADSPHLHQTAALFWHGSKSWPGGHWCLGVQAVIETPLLFASPLLPSGLKELMVAY